MKNPENRLARVSLAAKPTAIPTMPAEASHADRVDAPDEQQHIATDENRSELEREIEERNRARLDQAEPILSLECVQQRVRDPQHRAHPARDDDRDEQVDDRRRSHRQLRRGCGERESEEQNGGEDGLAQVEEDSIVGARGRHACQSSEASEDRAAYEEREYEEEARDDERPDDRELRDDFPVRDDRLGEPVRDLREVLGDRIDHDVHFFSWSRRFFCRSRRVFFGHGEQIPGMRQSAALPRFFATPGGCVPPRISRMGTASHGKRIGCQTASGAPERAPGPSLVGVAEASQPLHSLRVESPGVGLRIVLFGRVGGQAGIPRRGERRGAVPPAPGGVRRRRRPRRGRLRGRRGGPPRALDSRYLKRPERADRSSTLKRTESLSRPTAVSHPFEVAEVGIAGGEDEFARYEARRYERASILRIAKLEAADDIGHRCGDIDEGAQPRLSRSRGELGVAHDQRCADQVIVDCEGVAPASGFSEVLAVVVRDDEQGVLGRQRGIDRLEQARELAILVAY